MRVRCGQAQELTLRWLCRAPPAGFLAIRAEPEEFEAVPDFHEAVTARESGFDLAEDAIVEFHDPVALAAQGVMVLMAGGIIIGDFEPGQTIAKVNAVDQAHPLEQHHGAIDGGQIADVHADGFTNLLRRRGTPQPQQSV